MGRLRQIKRKCGAFLLSFIWLTQAEATLQTPPLITKSDKDEKTFSLRLKQAPLVPILQQLALLQHKNVIIDDALTGTLSLQLSETHFEKVLRAVAKLKQLQVEQDGSLYYLTTKPASAATNSALASEPLRQSKPSLVTRTLKLHFAKAAEVVQSLSSGQGSLLSEHGSLRFDERSNLLLIQDLPHSVQNIEKVVVQMDKPIEQIVIEARIVTIAEESLKELGVRWGMFDPTDAAHRVAGSLEANGFSRITDQLNVNFATSINPAGSLALQLAKINGRLLDLELTALERENNVEIIASPRLLTTNKKSASIKQGTEIPYVVGGTHKNDTQSIEFREAVLGLDVTPHISKDNRILLDLVVSQNSPGASVAYGSGEIVSIDKQEINTQVFARDGETIVLGGVFHKSLSKGVDKVPVLGDVPVIKHLFRKQSDREQKRELVIFVTPRIVKQEESRL